MVPWSGRRSTMWRHLRVRRPRFRWRSAVAAVALLGQVTTAFGIPIPALPGRARDFSRPFPCMDHPCGCHDADECWAGCCCLSDAEKLVWCEANGVEPPSFVRRNAKRERAQSKKKCCCCQDGDCAEHDDRAKPDAESKVRWVLGFAASRCHHHGPVGLLTTAPGLPPVAKSTAYEAILVERWALGALLPIPAAIAPPDPPPRSW